MADLVKAAEQRRAEIIAARKQTPRRTESRAYLAWLMQQPPTPGRIADDRP